MKCRRLKFEKDAGGNVLSRNIVWFGSYGLNEDGTAKFYNKNDKHDNYGKEKTAVADSLTQRLNVLQGELWYAVNSGIPLWDNHKDTNILDAYIATVVLSHPGVKSIVDFTSNVTQKDNKYSANIKIATIYGEIDISTTQML